MPARRLLGAAAPLLVALVAAGGAATSSSSPAPAVAQATTTTTAAPTTATPTTAATTAGGGQPDEDARQLAQGAAVFSRACTSCHQAGGVGIVGQFPPLKDNPNVADDAAYVRKTVGEGRQGRIEVKGETYNGVMPAVGNGLSDDEVAAVAAYVAANLELPEGVEAAEVPVPELPGPPDASLALMALGFGLAGVVAAIVLAPLVLARTDRVHLTWPEAALKTVPIVVYFVVAVVLVPGRVMDLHRMTELSPDVQYVVGSAVWGGGLVVGLVALGWAHRRRFL